MMKSKRKAAANVFMAQNVAQFDDEVEEMAADYEALPVQDASPDAPKPAVMAQKKSLAGVA